MSKFSKSLVLYADDDPEDLELVRRSLRNHENEVELVTFACAAHLLEFMERPGKNASPCLIILDIHMPQLGGRETLRLLRSKSYSRHVPVLLFTTSNQPTDKQFAARYEAGLLTKPLDSVQMEIVLMRIMNLCRQGHRDHSSGNRS